MKWRSAQIQSQMFYVIPNFPDRGIAPDSVSYRLHYGLTLAQPHRFNVFSPSHDEAGHPLNAGPTYALTPANWFPVWN